MTSAILDKSKAASFAAFAPSAPPVGKKKGKPTKATTPKTGTVPTVTPTPVAKATVEPAPKHHDWVAMEHAEAASQIILALHGLLYDAGHENLAKIAWIGYLQVSAAAEVLGDAMGVEVVTE